MVVQNALDGSHLRWDSLGSALRLRVNQADSLHPTLIYERVNLEWPCYMSSHRLGSRLRPLLWLAPGSAL
jgi:hypothetical protein